MTFDYQGVHGPDVSFYQDANSTPQKIDFQKMKAAGASFVIIRAGQNAWVDEDFKYNYAAAKKAGLPRGVYFFYDSRVSPVSQAQLCLSVIAGDYPELGIWLDLEESYRGQYAGWKNWRTCLAALRAKTPDVGIYTAPYYWLSNRPSNGDDLSYFATFPLWIAHYNVNTPIVPSPWKGAILWQMGTPSVGKLYGAESTEIDMNYFNGSPELFRTYFDLPIDSEPTPNPDPEGEEMTKDELAEVLQPFIGKMNELIDAVKAIPSTGGGGGTTPPPNPMTKPERKISFKLDEPNKQVPTYDVPDVNATKCLVYQTNTMVESVPPFGHKLTPKEPDDLERQIHWRKLYNEWAWVPKQEVKKPNGTPTIFPSVGTNGVDVSKYPGMWVLRSDMATATDTAWIERLVAYSMRTDR